MARAMGIDFVIKIGTDILAGQRGATLNRDADTIDVTAKDSPDLWRQNEASFKNWSIDSDGLVVEDDAAYLALETAYNNGDKVTVEISTPAGHKYGGSALITSFPVDAPYDDAATYSVSLLGDGALTKTPAV